MAEVEYVTRAKIINASCTFDLRELCSLVDKFFGKHNFDPLPNEISEKQLGDGKKDFYMHITAERDEDDYHVSIIVIKIWGKNLTPAKRKNAICSKGAVKIMVKSSLQLDAKNKWNKFFWTQFIRALYDKYADAPRHAAYKSELDKETHALHDEIRAFLGIQNTKT